MVEAWATHLNSKPCLKLMVEAWYDTQRAYTFIKSSQPASRASGFKSFPCSQTQSQSTPKVHAEQARRFGQ